jgi:hypothetical protein
VIVVVVVAVIVAVPVGVAALVNGNEIVDVIDAGSEAATRFGMRPMVQAGT